jgi:hypothetical protein
MLQNKCSVKSIALAQVTGKNISYIHVVQETYGGRGEYTTRKLNYIVILHQIPSSLYWASLVIKTKGLFRKEIIDLEWKGGTLADTLNADSKLKESLLTEFQLARPLDIVVAPEPIYQFMRIETDMRFPSANLFDYIDRVAALTKQHCADANSRPEKVLFEAKVEVNPRSKNKEPANLRVTERTIVFGLREPLEIPLYEAEDCSFSWSEPDATYTAVTGGRILNTVTTLRYHDGSGHSRTIEFAVKDILVSGDIRDVILNAYPKGVSR